jgi:hypothetical protein
MDNSLERIIPDLIDKNDPAEEIIHQLYLERYHYAAETLFRVLLQTLPVALVMELLYLLLNMAPGLNACME